MDTPGSKERFYKLLDLNPDEIDDTLDDRGLPTGIGDPAKFWGDVDAFSKAIEKWNSDEFIKLLNENDFPCVQVMAPGECWENPQVIENDI